MLNEILQAAGCERPEAVYVGDAEKDVEMANNAGVAPVVVLTGHIGTRQKARELAGRLGVAFPIIEDVTRLEYALRELDGS